jgi:hypothetical protein
VSVLSIQLTPPPYSRRKVKRIEVEKRMKGIIQLKKGSKREGTDSQIYEGRKISEEEEEEGSKQKIFRFPQVSPSGNAGLDSEPRNWFAITTVDYSSEVTLLQYCLPINVDGN